MRLEKKTEDWLENTYLSLPEKFYEKVGESRFPDPRLILWNKELAEELGIEERFSRFLEEEKAEIFSGNKKVGEEAAIAEAYCGHQFGYFTMLGDGRAKLIGEYVSEEGERYDFHLKGSGKTPYSRSGDGKAVLGPMLREYLMSEAIHALGIPTTRSLAVTLTGEMIDRYGPKKGAVLTRVAKSHIRVGTFEFARVSTKEDIYALADYTIERHYPELLELKKEGEESKYLKFLERVVTLQANLIAKWQLVGFIHGVMNTDNMSISGETIDYGPCAFMDAYNPKTVFSSIDAYGRYQYENQPKMAKWNLTRLSEALLPILHGKEEEALKLVKKELNKFDEIYEKAWIAGMRKKLGLNGGEEDVNLIRELLSLMEETKADFTNTFVRLTCAVGNIDANYLEGTGSLFSEKKFFEWTKKWKKNLEESQLSMEEIFSSMKTMNPFVIPRNYLVERALSGFEAGYENLFQEFYIALKNPYDYDMEKRKFQELNPVPDPYYRTYCGT